MLHKIKKIAKRFFTDKQPAVKIPQAYADIEFARNLLRRLEGHRNVGHGISEERTLKQLKEWTNNMSQKIVVTAN